MTQTLQLNLILDLYLNLLRVLKRKNKPAIHLEDVAIYQQKHLILNRVNIQLAKGEFVYLVGKTGSGKSTLMKTLYAQLPLLSGKGIVAGIELHKLPWRKVPKLRRKLGIIFQDFNLLTDRNVQENLLFIMEATGWTSKKKMQNRCDEILEKVGLKSKNLSMPHALSGGEQQRVAIARALLNSPEVILADEPTGNLDPDTSNEIIKVLRELVKDTDATVLMATHDYHILETFPERIIRCQEGKVVDQRVMEI